MIDNDIHKTLQKISFNSKDEYSQFLTQLMTNIASKGDFNIFMHQVCSHRTFMCDTKEDKIEGIKTYGLKVYPYPTLAGTAWFMGNANKIIIDKIVNYQFTEHAHVNQAFIFALPKYIYVDGEKVEYSSLDGEGVNLLNKNLTNRLVEAYKKRYEFLPMPPYTKLCLCDVLDYIHIPNIFCLGMQTVGENEFSFEINTQHFCFTNEVTKAKILLKLEKDTKKAYNKFGTKYLPDLIVEAFIDYEKNRDYTTDDID